MKRKTGFTLVELLAVITILGLIALIAIPAVTNTMSKQKEKLYYDQLNQLIMASKNWGTDHLDVLSENDINILKLEDLQKIDPNNNVKYLDDEFINPKTDEKFENISVYIYKKEKTYLYCVQSSDCVSGAKFDEYKATASVICCDGQDFMGRIEK